MRWIRKQNEPRQLTEWRLKYKKDPNLGYELLRKNKEAIAAVHFSLLEEQGYLCAYTGTGIDENSSHIEHIKPQTHCQPIETVTYTNIVACCPGANKPDPPYGAKKKDHWPSPAEAHLFVSPLEPSCESKFRYAKNGEIKYQAGDLAAQITIKKLGLNHKLLIATRKATIQGVLGKTNNLSLKDAKQRLKQLQNQNSGKLEPFCFVIIQALEKYIKSIEFRRAQKQIQSKKTKK
ncbi:hypothetical protein LEP3755_07140 [Leptolyngbya sp. NIES-3755]|nr:hypothetical protein LEP3755_07140 [Leptolyngbya sp. NIES-3755]